MKNFIEYFYNMRIDKIKYEDKSYSFVYNGYLYKMYIYDNYGNVNFLLEVNKKLIGNTLMSEIISNRNGEIISINNNIPYILIRIYANGNKVISLEEISYLANSLYKDKIQINWGNLWSRKIDYLEDLINENGKKYPIIVDSFNYFVGMAENAISYYNNIVLENDYKYVVSHKVIRFDDTVEALYNPLNIIFDYRVRDVAEYLKNSFFRNNYNVYYELDNYLKNSNLSLSEVKLLVARLLYPSFYFDMYEDIIIDGKEEKIILEVVTRLNEYEIYLSQIIDYLRKVYGVDDVLWLKKRRLN
ncbi:MAG: hypothetical protein Q4C23_02410 [Mycoplasmatota bacterium]|nr:hypothetical protein [Mycoplasmatota bacterium]